MVKKPVQLPSGIKMNYQFTIETFNREELQDITHFVESFVAKSDIQNGLINVYAQGATSAIMIQENWDESIQTDVINLLKKLVPNGVWLHDQQDGNGDAHLKAGIIGPSETIPIIEGKIGLSRWQNIFFCEFDGPRKIRHIVCTLINH
jgi:secondary thiamine-phosphate synthase enzyme